MQKIKPCLWFDGDALEAAEFYTGIFRNSRIVSVSHYGEAASKASGQAEGTVMVVEFLLDGCEFMALNGGPMFQFTPAISFSVNCESKEELDAMWEALAEGGETEQCGWLRDKFGMSWQIVPAVLSQMILDEDVARKERVMSAVMGMNKLEWEVLEEAYR